MNITFCNTLFQKMINYSFTCRNLNSIPCYSVYSINLAVKVVTFNKKRCVIAIF